MKRIVLGLRRNSENNQIRGNFALCVNEVMHLNKTRALGILQRLDPVSHHELAGAAVRELAEGEFSSVTIYEFVRALSAQGFVGASFRDDCGYALRKIAIRENGLPDGICQLLAQWLTTDAFKSASTTKQAETLPVDDTPKGEPSSILWPHPGGFLTYPNDWFWIGEAIKLGYCYRPSHKEWTVQVESWIVVFDRCTELPFPVEVWEAWLYELLRFCPAPELIAPSVIKVCKRRTDVLHSSAGMLAVARFGKWINTSDRQDFVQRLLSSTAPKSRQGGAELAVFYGIRLDDEAVKQIVEGILRATGGSDENVAELLGIAFAAANLSTDDASRYAAVDLIARLLPTDVEAIHDAVMHAFDGEEALQNDAVTQKLLETISNGIQFRRGRDAYSLVKKLTHFVTLNPHFTCRVMRRIVDEFFELKKSPTQFHVGYFDDELVNIILTLHRHPDPRLGEQSLTLFEDLMDLEVAGAFEKLKEIDLR